MEETTLFHDVRPIGHVTQGKLEDWFVHTLELNGEEIKILVADFFGKMHVEDYLDQEASLEMYFEWKPMNEN